MTADMPADALAWLFDAAQAAGPATATRSGPSVTDGGDQLRASRSVGAGTTDTVLQTAGELVAGTDGTAATTLAVGSHPDGVTLSVETAVGRVAVLLSPADIERLCSALTEAASATDSAIVERACGRVTEYSDTGR